MNEDIKVGKIEYEKGRSLISNDPLKANNYLQKYIEEYPNHYKAYISYIETLIVLSKFDEAEKIINDLEKKYKKDFNFISKKENVEYMENKIYYKKLKIYAYKGKYQEFCDLYNSKSYLEKYNNEERNSSSAYFYCLNKIKKFDLENRNKEKWYVYKQMIQYNKDDFFRHLEEHLAKNHSTPKQEDISVFVSNFPIRKVYDEIIKYIPSENKMCEGFYDNTYVFKLDNCGFNNKEMTNYFKVVCFHNTNNVITMYPCKNLENWPIIDLNYLNKKNNYLTKSKQLTLTCGDIISLNRKKYLVKKIADKNKWSLISLVKEEDAELTFFCNKRKFNVLKNAVICDVSNAQIVDRLGKKVIEDYEKAKKINAKSKR